MSRFAAYSQTISFFQNYPERMLLCCLPATSPFLQRALAFQRRDPASDKADSQNLLQGLDGLCEPDYETPDYS
jgi:hypothetical protein